MADGVREAALENAGAIAEIQVATWRAAYAGLLPRPFLDELSVRERGDMWHRILGEQRPRTHVFVCWQDETITGFAAAGPSHDEDADQETGQLYALYVDPRRWRQGTGRALEARVSAALDAAEFRAATLWVLDANQRARRFYRATGWALDGGARTESLGHGVEAGVLRYRKEIRVSGRRPGRPRTP